MQTVTLASHTDQILVRTPWGEAFVVSAQIVGTTQHIYLTPPEGYEPRPSSTGTTTIFERSKP